MNKVILPLANSHSNTISLLTLFVMAVFLTVVLLFGLTGALISGFTVYCCSQALSGSLLKKMDSIRARQVAVGLLSFIIVGILVLAGIYLVAFLESDGVGKLALKMSNVLTELRPHLPSWLTATWPHAFDTPGEWLGKQLQEHAATAQSWGQDFLHGVGRIIIGMFIGGIVSVTHLGSQYTHKPLVNEMLNRIANFTTSFTQVVFAQFKIALLNSILTGIFLAGVLPLMGVHLPLTKTLIIITFLMGLIPVLGNLISNTIITLVGLSVAPWVAAVSLLYLIIIHKLEYLLNAKIVGGHIDAKAWEILISMVIMEAMFGITGIIVAPIYYAYFKREFKIKGWI